jgi:hypothetical protein
MVKREKSSDPISSLVDSLPLLVGKFQTSGRKKGSFELGEMTSGPVVVRVISYIYIPQCNIKLQEK